MKHRISRLWLKIKAAGGIDLVLAHAPAAGVDDGEDYAHRGFECFNELLERYKPRYFVHGHVHMNYGRDIPRSFDCGETRIINAYERYELEL